MCLESTGIGCHYLRGFAGPESMITEKDREALDSKTRALSLDQLERVADTAASTDRSHLGQ